jgi:hypothetical protein
MSKIEKHESIRLPKAVEEHARSAAVSAALAARMQPVWTGGDLAIPVVDLSAALARSLKSARSAGRVVRGLERTEEKLAAEARGLDRVDRRLGVARGERVSRLILVADDCAERMYRRVETLLRRNRGRVLVLRLECGGHELGSLLFDAGSGAKLLMLDHKDAVADALLALAKPAGQDRRSRHR